MTRYTHGSYASRPHTRGSTLTRWSAPLSRDMGSDILDGFAVTDEQGKRFSIVMDVPPFHEEGKYKNVEPKLRYNVEAERHINTMEVWASMTKEQRPSLRTGIFSSLWERDQFYLLVETQVKARYAQECPLPKVRGCSENDCRGRPGSMTGSRPRNRG